MQQITKDLCIMPFKNESKKAFGNRVIYSAIVAWAKIQLLGRPYTEINNKEYAYPCVSQQYITYNLRPIVKGLLQSLPYDSKWLVKEIEQEELTKYIIDQLIFTYEINKLWGGKVTATPTRVTHFKENELLLGGVEWNCSSQKTQAIGLGRWRKKQLDLAEDYKECFHIPNHNAETYYQAIRQHATWIEYELKREWNLYEVFIPGQEEKHAKSWRPLKELTEGMTLIRKKDLSTYMLLKYEAGKYYTAKLDPWYREEYEIYRIQYMLNLYSGRQTTFKAEQYDDHIILHCHRLPNAESRIMLLGSWPYKKYNDIFSRIIPINLWKDIEDMLTNLGIRIIY